jgi:hypothetical protein
MIPDVGDGATSVMAIYRQLSALAYKFVRLFVRLSPDYLPTISSRLSPDYLLDNSSGSASCSCISRPTSPRVLRRKPILSEQALPVLRRSPRTRSCPITRGLRRRRHADSHTIEDIRRGADRTHHACRRDHSRAANGRSATLHETNHVVGTAGSKHPRASHSGSAVDWRRQR